MLHFSKDERKALREAIQSAYPDPAKLAIFVAEELYQNIAIVGGSGSHDVVIFNLITWAEAGGYSDDLILALQRETKNRPDIQQLCARVLRQRIVLNSAEHLTEELSLDLEPSVWGIDVYSEEFESFLPKQFTFEADVGKLQLGLELANAVCKITFADRPPAESGTGVLVKPNLVLTNYHVLSLKDDVDLAAITQSVQFEFGYVSPKFGETTRTQILKAAANEPIVSFSPIHELDYVLIRLESKEDFCTKPVTLNATASLTPRSPLNILQHPEGLEMKVSLSNNGVVKTNEQRGLVLYVNPTKRGSSGSPCFDDDWKLIALHHKGIQTSFGSIREGILLSAIHRHIKAFASVTL